MLVNVHFKTLLQEKKALYQLEGDKISVFGQVRGLVQVLDALLHQRLRRPVAAGVGAGAGRGVLPRGLAHEQQGERGEEVSRQDALAPGRPGGVGRSLGHDAAGWQTMYF